MLINPLLILIGLAVIILVTIICIVKSPSIPLLSACTILILAVYIVLAYTVNSAIMVSEFPVSESVREFLLSFALYSKKASITYMEQAFNHFVILINITAVISLFSLIADIARIFFKRSKI